MSFGALLISLLVVVFGVAILTGIIYLLMKASKK